MYGPILQGERVCLRPHQPDDGEAFIVMLADLEVTQYLAIQLPPELEWERNWLRERGSDPNTIGWTIEVKKKPVGTIGFDIDWKHGHATVGIFIGDKSLWNQGIATEAGRLAGEYIFTQTILRKIKSGYLDDNIASGRLQVSAGLLECGRWRQEFFRNGKWYDHVLTEILREDWEKLRSNS